MRIDVRFAAAALMALAGSMAFADQTDQGTLQEVIVTAEKRAEPLQNVPEAVSALTGAELQAMGAESFTDYARTIPGLTFTDEGAGRDKPAIRGINETSGEPTVGYYIGETPLPAINGNYGNTIANPELVDINRIEVLRGPQGTLYGSGSVGGTIKLVPNEPNLTTVEGSVEADGLVTEGADGASPGVEGNGVLNVPLIDGVAAIRAVAWARDVGGFINRTYGYTGDFSGATPPRGTIGNIPDEHTWGIRTLGLIKPTDNLRISALVYLQDQRFNGFQDITGGASNPNNSLVQNLISNVEEPSENRFSLTSLTARYDFQRFNVLSSTGYYTGSTIASEEGTSTLQVFLGAPAFPNELTAYNTRYNFTEEARAATSERIYGFDGLIGYFYSQGHTTLQDVWAPPQYNALVANNDPSNPLYSPGDDLYSDPLAAYENQRAIFGELTYHVTEALSITGGLRHFSINNGESGFITGLFNNFAAPTAIQQVNINADSHGLVHKGNISYQITPHHLLYVQYSEGFRPGFAQIPVPSYCNAPVGSEEVQPDSIKNYEIGAKTTWLDKRMTINGDVYKIDWSHIQQLTELECGFGIVTNVGEAINKGVELEVSGQISRRLTAGLSGNYISAKLQQTDAAVGTYAGDQIENVPNWQYALFATTTFPVFEANDGFVRVDYQYRGSSYGLYTRLSDGERDPGTALGALRLLNLRAGLNYRAWEFSVSGTNLLNNIARQSIEESLIVDIPGRPRYVVNRPRTFLIGASYSF